jgi:hypothetical protein
LNAAALVPWLPPPMSSLYAAAPQAWREEFWFGQPWDLLAAGAVPGGDAGASPSGSAVVRSVKGVLLLKQLQQQQRARDPSPDKALVEPLGAAPAAPATNDASSSPFFSSAGAPPPPPAWSLGTIPQLSPRLQLTLLLRRCYEAHHMGGFERMSPPAAGPHRAQLARRYRRIAEHVPPSLRESFAFAKRRTEALAMRAAAEAKASALAALRAR